MARTVNRYNQSDANPIGMIVPSMLTEVQFQAANGTGWVLADGRNVAGTRYATITGSSTVPDLRGVALRGKNNGRADGNQNPDGELALGTFQGHAFGSHSHAGNTGTISADHSHNYSQLSNNAGIAGGSTGLTGASANTFGSYNQTTAGVNSNHTHAISADGSNESRMRNVTVNHFIKVNP